jgi:hypothetical protein
MARGLHSCMNSKKVNSPTAYCKKSLYALFGATGKSSFGAEAQEWVQQNISGSPIYQDWGSQVPGELAVNLHFGHELFRKEDSDASPFSILILVGAPGSAVRLNDVSISLRFLAVRRILAALCAFATKYSPTNPYK